MRRGHHEIQSIKIVTLIQVGYKNGPTSILLMPTFHIIGFQNTLQRALNWLLKNTKSNNNESHKKTVVNVGNT